ncbi:MAG: type VI secretion system baseplate subunit TssF [Planctomycetes bacterium]|nr:type VI secretion system baseplate subunit TssF [Planctomycetota bacterium]
MTEELLPYYQRELSFIRKMGAEFAEHHPEVAAALRLGPDASQDPHVERMIMAFAFLAARIRHKLDDDFPELTSALLGVLYPHYLSPIPSMAIVAFDLDRSQAGLTEGYRIPAGKILETAPIGGEPCLFRTSYPVVLWPIEVTSASLGALPLSAEAPEGSTAVLRLELRCLAKELTFAKMKLSRLRFFLNGQPQHVFALYELLFNNVVDVTLANVGKSPNPSRLGKVSILPVGFEEDEGILPYSPRSFLGYRLLTEFFAFAPKFCFFDLAGLDAALLRQRGNAIEVRFFLNRTTSDLEQNVSAETFRLGCTPMVNLFPQRAEPIRLTETHTEYRVVPDARRPLATEVYSVDRVTATSPAGDEVEYGPFYSLKHGVSRAQEQTFWHASRRPSTRSGDQADHGTELFLSLVDLEFMALSPGGWTVLVETTCLNRDLPGRLPFGGGQPRLKPIEGGPVTLACLTAPTPTLRLPTGGSAMWRIISHLTLNHLSIANRDGSPDALQEILKLYDFKDSPETRSKISGILGVSSRSVVSRLPLKEGGGFCRGMEIDIQFDEERFSDNSLFLFASILERFLGLYCSINSFTRLVTSTRQRRRIFGPWPPRVARRMLL